MLTLEKKQKLREQIKSTWDGYHALKNSFFYRDRENIATIRQIMVGAVDVEQYQKALIPEELGNDDESGNNINWSPLDIYSKYRRIVIRIVKQMMEELAIEIADSKAVDSREDFFSDVVAKIYMKQKLEEYGANPADVIPDHDRLPADIEELEMFMEYDYKEQAAIEFETILNYIKDKATWYEDTYEKLIEDLHDIGAAVSEDVEDNDGEIRPEYVDPEFFICSYTATKGFKDLDSGGKILSMTLADMSRRMHDEDAETQEKFRELKKIMENSYDGVLNAEDKIAILSTYQDLNSGNLNVLHLYWKTGETEEYEVRTTKDGRKVFGHKSGGSKNKKFMEGEYDVVYEGYWIIGSDVYFGIKKKEYVTRDPDDVKVGQIPFHVFAPEKYHMHLNSMGRQAIPSIHAMNLAWYKLQNAIRAAKPGGVAYDLTALESVPIGQTDLTPQKNILTYNLTGNIAFRGIDEDGNPVSTPIVQLRGGLGSEGKDYVDQIIINENMFRSLTGLNEIVDGSSPNPRTLKSVAQAAAVASNNALKYLHEAAQKIDLSISKAILQRVQDQAETEEINIYKPALGSNSVEFFKITKDHSMRQLGLKFIPQPTAEEEQRLNDLMALALKTPKGGEAQLTIAQKVKLDSISNKKYALKYLAYVIEKNKREAIAQKQADMQLQGQINIQAAQASEAAKQQTSVLNHQHKIAEINAEGVWKVRVAQIQASGDIQQDSIKADSRDRESKRMAETKLATERMRQDQPEPVQ